MKVKLKYRIEVSESVIDLEDLGYNEDVAWDDLTWEEKNEITDNESIQTVVYVRGENYED